MKFVIEHLSKSFEKRKFSEILILHLMKGNLWLLGRNGAGKTTLFNCLNRDLKRG